MGPLLVCRVFRYSCFPLYIRTGSCFLQKSCIIDMPFRRIEDSTGITLLRSQDTTACWLEACLLAGSRSAGAVVFRMQPLLSRWGFGLVQLIVVVVVAVSLVRWGFGLDATGGDAVAAFVTV